MSQHTRCSIVHVFLRHLPPVFDIWTGYWYTQLPQPLILPINGLIGPRSNDNVLYRANSSLIVLFDRHHNHEHVDIVGQTRSIQTTGFQPPTTSLNSAD